MSHHASTRLFYFLQYKSWKYSFDFTFRHKFAFHDAFIISSQRELLIFIFCWYNLFVSFWSVAMILVENHRSLEFESNDFVMNIGGILRFHMLDFRISTIRIRSKYDDQSSFHTKIFLWLFSFALLFMSILHWILFELLSVLKQHATFRRDLRRKERGWVFYWLILVKKYFGVL